MMDPLMSEELGSPVYSSKILHCKIHPFKTVRDPSILQNIYISSFLTKPLWLYTKNQKVKDTCQDYYRFLPLAVEGDIKKINILGENTKYIKFLHYNQENSPFECGYLIFWV